MGGDLGTVRMLNRMFGGSGTVHSDADIASTSGRPAEDED